MITGLGFPSLCGAKSLVSLINRICSQYIASQCTVLSNLQSVSFQNMHQLT